MGKYSMRSTQAVWQSQQRNRRRPRTAGYYPVRCTLWLYQPHGDRLSKGTGEHVPGVPIPWPVTGGIVKQRVYAVEDSTGVVLERRAVIFWCYADVAIREVNPSWTLKYDDKDYIVIAVEPRYGVGGPKILHIHGERVA